MVIIVTGFNHIYIKICFQKFRFLYIFVTAHPGKSYTYTTQRQFYFMFWKLWKYRFLSPLIFFFLWKVGWLVGFFFGIGTYNPTWIRETHTIYIFIWQIVMNWTKSKNVHLYKLHYPSSIIWNKSRTKKKIK